METVGFILYVANQARSMEFYKKLLKTSPSLNEPGMTEFNLSETVKLGLMPESGISNIICPAMPHPKNANGIPRCELYLKVKNPADYMQRAMQLGAKNISEFQTRDWGDTVGYIADLDGHIIAFAKTTINSKL
ncbi:MAG TPA: VOC family protein [Aequorivita sp.]|jgi:predicted enzyme related to lactoylglutathione lyase|nr:VOC family protein [Aequorivita sp.]|tara:strand:+ start:244144 stop:244542 length:399 start_codon:yes stop_codon:yes gene_type:complete